MPIFACYYHLEWVADVKAESISDAIEICNSTGMARGRELKAFQVQNNNTMNTKRDRCIQETNKAEEANTEAHDNYPDIAGIKLTRVKIVRGYAKLKEDVYNTEKLHLALHHGTWMLGKICYHQIHQSYYMMGGWWVNHLQVEHVQQLYMTDLPAIPGKIVEFPPDPEDEDIE